MLTQLVRLASADALTPQSDPTPINDVMKYPYLPLHIYLTSLPIRVPHHKMSPTTAAKSGTLFSVPV